jgi:GTP-binding protein
VRGSPVIALSAETGRGLERLMPAVFKVHDDWSTKVKTRDLNDWLAMAVQRHPPPAVNGRRVKPKYVAQTKARPPTFVLFASRADQLPDHYRRYLINSLRESFDLPGVPMRLTVKSNKNPYAEGEEKGGPKPRSSVPNFAPKIGKKVAAPKGVAATRAKIAAGPPVDAPVVKAKPKSKPKVKPKTKLMSAGKLKIGPGATPKGRTAKLNRPGVKPKRASRPTSNRKSGR